MYMEQEALGVVSSTTENWVWWQEGQEFNSLLHGDLLAKLGYLRPCLKNKKQTPKESVNFPCHSLCLLFFYEKMAFN